MSCHLILIIQIYLLSGVQNLFKACPFRIHLFFLHAPVMAVLFPETNHRSLLGHVETFWSEHILLLSVPIIMMQHYRFVAFNIIL